MIDLEIDKTLKELKEILKVDAFNKLYSHLGSLVNQIEDLRKSRSNWREKYEKFKKNN